MANTKHNLDELDWVKIREELNTGFVQETFYEKVKRKTQENPLVPIGCLATAGALSYGLVSFSRGKSQMQQYMMRARIGAQAFTIACIVAGLLLLPKKD